MVNSTRAELLAQRSIGTYAKIFVFALLLTFLSASVPTLLFPELIKAKLLPDTRQVLVGDFRRNEKSEWIVARSRGLLGVQVISRLASGKAPSSVVVDGRTLPSLDPFDAAPLGSEAELPAWTISRECANYEEYRTNRSKALGFPPSVIEYGTGFPCVACVSRISPLPSDGKALFVGSRATFGPQSRFIGTQIVWLGVLCNTCVNFGLLLLAHALVKAAIEKLRERKNCCPNCNYSLAGLSDQRCPECGTIQRPKHPAEKSTARVLGSTP